MLATWALLLSLQAPERIDWLRLRGFNARTGRITADTLALDGKRVRLKGYVVNAVKGFVLIPHAGTPNPPVNQRVSVSAKPPLPAAFEYVAVEGTLRIIRRGGRIDGFALDADTVKKDRW